MISLGPLRYRNVLQERGGPIARLTFRKRTVLDGQEWFEVHATLRSGLKPDSVLSPSILYSSDDGGGCAREFVVAKFKAISEAIERWAAASVAAEPDASRRYGFDIEPSTTGFAAFPGIFPASARAAALSEACERWTLSSFWEGKIGVERLAPIHAVDGEVDSFRLAAPFPGIEVVLLHRRSKMSGSHAYGFAADKEPASALARASVELLRNEDALRAWENGSIKRCASQKGSLSLWERRVLHFASVEGHAQFADRIARASIRQRAAASLGPAPRLVIDQRVEGPWEKHAWVWRCVFEPVSGREWSDADYFVF